MVAPQTNVDQVVAQLTSSYNIPRVRPPQPVHSLLGLSRRQASLVLHAGLRQPRQGAASLSQEQDFVVCATAREIVTFWCRRSANSRDHPGRVFARYGAQKLGSPRRPI